MPFKDEQLVIIAPGSQTTLAQLGIQESIAPAQLRLRSCMFPGDKDGEWEPFKVRPWPKSTEAPTLNETGAPIERIEPEFYEDYAAEDDAVWPLEGGKITNWSCFFALLTYVHRRLSPHLHSPMLLIAQSSWTARDYEKLTQFFFEKFKPPCFVIVDSALSTLWAYNVVNACVVDVGFEKSDVTAITDFAPHFSGRGLALSECGGDSMTSNLLQKLKSKGFNKEMSEQLKRSAICEILAPGVPLPGTSIHEEEPITNPAAAASTGALGSGPGQRTTAGALGEAPRGPGPDTEVGDEATDGIEADGVLDVASIVAGGNKKMEEFLAKKDKEKQEKGAKKKAGDAAPATSKAVKLRNADKGKAIFSYELPAHLQKSTNGTIKEENGSVKPPAGNGQPPAETNGSAAVESAQIEQPTTKEIEVGLERFQADSTGVIARIADAVHLAISSVEDVSKRSEVWDNLIVVGNGAKIRGFREALLATIQQKYIISPSSATIFTSELPSHITTPTGTGTNTPQPQVASGPLGINQSSNVNPLLVAAVTSQTQHLNPSTSQLPSAHSHNYHSSHGQTPTSVKYAKMGEYFPEWKDIGFDEAQFLGAQVMAKVLFIVDNGQSKGYMTRNDYNEMGPSGIHEFGP